MLHSVENEYDMICIQETHINFQAFSRATGVWMAVYPTGFKHDVNSEDRPRALTLVHTRLSMNVWTQVPVNLLDMSYQHIKGEQRTLNVYNIYNDCTHSETVRVLERHLERREVEAQYREDGGDRVEGDIWLGDFNRHNPWWEDVRNERLFTR
ncbi:hypothetical protein BYT27DRAFT_7108375 [Phlegmacium glaucopus]|nr:hypothetical protein BYT27DRAFT_7108375 [Phlegmacium glaucopus]